MTIDSYITALWSLIAIAICFAAWQYGIKPLIDETFRQRLFEKRDALFDRAYRGELQFSSADYTATRALINAHIRFFHRLDGLQLLGAVVFFRTNRGGRMYDPADAITDPYCRKLLQQTIMNVCIGALFKSPAAAVIIALLFMKRRLNDKNTPGAALNRDLDHASPYFDELARKS